MTFRNVGRLAILAGVLAAAGIAGAVIFYPHMEPATLSYKIRGVDVSAHQGTIDWLKLKGDGVAFAYIKASEGGDFTDPEFATNWRAAAKAGAPHGAYHFLTQCQSGLVQAQNFIRAVPVEPDALPPVVDAEHMGPCTKGPQVKDIVAELTVFLDEVELHYGKRPIIYTTQEFHDAYLVGLFPDERFWIRSLFFEPGFRKGQWTFWQYHNKGQRAGILGPVDLNAFGGTQAEFDAMMQ
ncbi:MAG TPA: GH25 family lysozyme [Hyphomonadaceae bacterium]|jgi:lysozyme|nr:GH25 family lysozyme [Hyphomonadaceae bacterium]